MHGHAPKIFFLELTLTALCDLNCLSCEARGKPDYIESEEVSDEDWIEAVRDAVDMSVKRIHILGAGEALIIRDLVYEIVEIIGQNHIYGSLQTSGTLFTEKLVRKMVETGFDSVYISLDAPDPETNDYLRGKAGTFDRIIQNIKAFNLWKNKIRSGFPELYFTPVLTSKNYDKLDRMVLLAKKLHVKTIRAQPLLVDPSNPLGRELMLTRDQMGQLQDSIQSLVDLADREGIENNFRQLVPEIVEESCALGDVIKKDMKKKHKHGLLEVPCFEPWIFLGIDSTGTIKTCPNEPGKGNPYNIKTDELKSVWQNERYENIRKTFLDGRIMPYCQNCCGIKILEITEIKEKIIAGYNEDMGRGE